MAIPTENTLRRLARALAEVQDQIEDAAADADNAAEDAARAHDARRATEAARMAEALWRLGVQARRGSDELDALADRAGQLAAIAARQ